MKKIEKKKRTMSPEGRERIAQATRDRWARVRAEANKKLPALTKEVATKEYVGPSTPAKGIDLPIVVVSRSTRESIEDLVVVLDTREKPVLTEISQIERRLLDLQKEAKLIIHEREILKKTLEELPKGVV